MTGERPMLPVAGCEAAILAQRDPPPRRWAFEQAFSGALVAGPASSVPCRSPTAFASTSMAGRSGVSATFAFRVAKALDVSLHHVLTGTALPPGTCKHCGRSNDA